VDFRVRDFWRSEPSVDSVPLLYAHHFLDGGVTWPRRHKKPNALTLTPETKKLLMPPGFYTLIKRFSAKEERRRVVAYTLDPSSLPRCPYGIENHLNVIHCGKQSLEPNVARGLAVFLNSTVVDHHFRSFSGHTQVNATDLRQMRFPDAGTLKAFGDVTVDPPLAQSQIDELVDAV
jgi:adenine-specific DNA-methyltransferase